MQELILLKYGELALKGLNRPVFEDALIRNIRRRLYHFAPYTLKRAQSAIFLMPQDDTFDMDGAVERLGKVFGLSSVVRACVVEKDMTAINAAAVEYLRPELENARTFKVEARRSDKRFPQTSPQIMANTGEAVLNAYPSLKVDIHHPELVVTVEIRDFGAYIHGAPHPGAGGLPAGTGGRAALLISGGIDSPVAGYMMASRGLSLCAVHFASPPYTSERAKEKVLDLLKIVSGYSGRIITYVVPFTKIQESIRQYCREDFFTVVMRRMMMRIAARIAQDKKCAALITGESAGQVASQTVEAIACTDAAAPMPVLRPLIGMDKESIITIARKIDTFETSILPYEDCCTVFTPKHPRTRPILKYVEETEGAFDFAPLIDEAVKNAEEIVIGY